jgi:predicted ribosomally synthesized peptide with SipW-like signal peptide
VKRFGRGRRIAMSAVVVGIVAAISGTGTWAAFSDTTGNSANVFAAGTVRIADNDSGSAMMTLTDAYPGDGAQGCIQVTYSGTLDADVRLYANVTGTLGQYLTLTVTRGSDPSPSFPGCGGFTPDATDYNGDGPGVIYEGDLDAFPGGWGGGVVDPGTWSTSDSHAYRFEVTLQNDDAAEARTAGADFVWEARNQ